MFLKGFRQERSWEWSQSGTWQQPFPRPTGDPVILFVSIVTGSHFWQPMNRLISLNQRRSVSICVGKCNLEKATVRDAKVAVFLDVNFLSFCSFGFSGCSRMGVTFLFLFSQVG